MTDLADYIAARAARDFKTADEIRALMRAAGIVLEIRRDGTVRERPLKLSERLPADPRTGPRAPR